MTIQRLYQPVQTGFSLIEALVAVLVLAIGLLGLAGLQGRSLSNNHNAYLRLQATQLAYDMVDRIRANTGGVTDGAYQADVGTTDNCSTSSCTSAQMAGYDITRWNSDLATQLPNGTGTIAVTGSVYTVTVSWSERENGQAATKQFTTSFQP